MDDRQELNDIMISETDKNIVGSKKILVFGAAGTLLFLIAIFVVYLVSRSGGEQEKEKQANLPKELIAPTGIPDGQLNANKLPSEPAFVEVPVKDATTNQDEQQKPAEQPKPDDKLEKVLKDIKDKTKNEPKQETIGQKPTIAAQEPQMQEQSKSQPQKSESKSQSAGDSIPGGIYIQIGAFSRLTPDKKFIEQIESNNFSYKLYKTEANGAPVVKVLIGPYTNEKEAKAALASVRNSVAKQAFIVRK